MTVRGAARVRRGLAAGRRWAGAWQPQHRTALRVPADREPPPPSAFARFGRGSWVVPPAEVVGARRTEIGDEVVILEHSALVVGEAGLLQIGDRTRLARGVHILCTRSVVIGEAVSSSDHVAIVDAWAPEVEAGLATRLPPPQGEPVVIERGAYLGFGCVVGPGVRVGAGAFVGEGAVVLDDVAPHTVVYGNPARPIRSYEESTGAWVGSVLP